MSDLMEILADKEANASDFQPGARDTSPVPTLPSTNLNTRVRLEYAVRFALGISIVLIWSVLALNLVWGEWIDTQKTATQAAQKTPSKTESFMTVTSTARAFCPPQASVLMLNNGSVANNLADYFLYPRRVDLIELSDPFSSTDLDAHVGGCLLYYGPEAAHRLDPIRARLNEVICSGEGCLYTVKR